VRHNPPVPWRRLLLFAVLLIVGTSLVSATTTQDRRADDSGKRAETPPSNPPASVVEASLPANKEVRARVGDVVRLRVRAPSFDVVELAGLAVEEPVEADQPTELVLVADREGRFRVRLRDANEAIGTLRVTT
jgi:hypothetical protein